MIYCSEHTDNADSRCITCEAAREWIEKDATISSLQARIEELEEAAKTVVENSEEHFSASWLVEVEAKNMEALAALLE